MMSKDSLFPGQRPDERVIVFTRRHWLQLAISFIAVIFLVGAYIAAIAIILAVTDLTLRGTSGVVINTISGIAFLMGWLFLYIKFVDYYLDVWILTTERMVQVKQKSLFNRQIAKFDLSAVQDVSSRSKGIFATFLKFGTIFVQTAGTTELFSFRYMPKPDEVARKILDVQNQLEEQTRSQLGEVVQEAQQKNQNVIAPKTSPRETDELRKGFPDMK